MDSLIKRLKALQPEIDHQGILAQMPEQSHPRRKLKEFQNKGYLIRVKNGFYVFDPDFLGRPYSPPIVANLLYGPSYISLEYALSFHRLIPERVETLTSVTTQKNKQFETAIGNFSYAHLHASLYPLGVTIAQTSDNRQFLIATPEKALLDFFTLKMRSSGKPTLQDIAVTLEEDLRIDLSTLKNTLQRQRLENMRLAYKNRPWCKLLINFILEEL